MPEAGVGFFCDTPQWRQCFSKNTPATDMKGESNHCSNHLLVNNKRPTAGSRKLENCRSLTCCPYLSRQDCVSLRKDKFDLLSATWNASRHSPSLPWPCCISTSRIHGIIIPPPGGFMDVRWGNRKVRLNETHENICQISQNAIKLVFRLPLSSL